MLYGSVLSGKQKIEERMSGTLICHRYENSMVDNWSKERRQDKYIRGLAQNDFNSRQNEKKQTEMVQASEQDSRCVLWS